MPLTVPEDCPRSGPWQIAAGGGRTACARRRGLPALALLIASLPASALEFDVAGIHQHDFGRYRLEGDANRTDLVRRTRLALFARRGDQLQAKWEYDLVAGRTTDAYLGWRWSQGTQLRAGQFKQPFGFEQQSGSRDLVLLERSMVDDAFAIGRRVGLQWSRPWSGQTLQLSVFGGDLESPSAASGLAARLYSPPLQDGRLHLGLSLAGESRSDERLRLRARAESRLLPFAPLDTGLLPVESGNWRSGLEAAWLQGPLALQGELIALRTESSALSGEGASVTGSWTLGGERRLRNGAVTAPKLDSGRVFEISARASFVDFDAGATHLGRQSQIGLGASAWLGRHLRLQLEHGQLRASRSAALSRPGRVDAGITTLRVQLGF